MIPTSRADLSDLQAPPAFLPPVPDPPNAEDEPSIPVAEPAALDHDPPTPRTPVPGQMLAMAAEPKRRGGRGGGVALIAVLVLLIIIGGAVGYLLFQWAGITP